MLVSSEIDLIVRWVILSLARRRGWTTRTAGKHRLNRLEGKVDDRKLGGVGRRRAEYRESGWR